MSRVMFLLGGIGVGAGGMYFFDPEQGDRRRAQLRQRLQVGLDQTLNTLEQGSQELKLRARSVIQEAEQNLVPGQGQQGPQGAMGPMGDNQRNQLATVAGGALALYGVFRRGIIGSALTTIGVGMLSRGLGLGQEQGGMNQGFRPGMQGPQGFQPGMQQGFQPGMQGPQGFQPGMQQGPGAPMQPGMQGQGMPPQGAPQQNPQGAPQQNLQGPPPGAPQQNPQGPPPGNAQRGPEGNRPRDQGPARGA